MNGLRAKDVLILGGGAVLLICVFLPFYDLTSGYGPSVTVWHEAFLSVLLLGFGTGLAAAVLVALDRFSTVGDVGGRVGLTLDQLTGVLAVVSSVQMFLGGTLGPLGHTVGQWFALLASVAILCGTVLSRWVPALEGPVGGDPLAGARGQSSFWFAVSTPTPVHDASTGAMRATLQPGRWYLAHGSYGAAWPVTDLEFGSAVLHDLSGVIRADAQRV